MRMRVGGFGVCMSELRCVREPQLRVASPLRVRQPRGDARLDDDDGRQHGGERRLSDDAH